MQVSMSFSNNKSFIFWDIIQILHFTQKMFEVSMFKKLITMNLLRKEFLQDLFSGVLIFFLIITGYANQVKASDEIPIEGAVYSVHRSDGSIKTYIDVVIGRRFPGRLPADIDSIIVSGPDGDLSIDKDDFNYYPQWRAFWPARPGSPEVGTYTFKVTSGNRSGYATECIKLR